MIRVNPTITKCQIYERVIKDQIVCGMEKYFSPFLSAYRKNYSSQNILISLTEEWRKKLDNNFVVGALLTDLSKAFDCIPHDLIIAKLLPYHIKSSEYLESFKRTIEHWNGERCLCKVCNCS